MYTLMNFLKWTALTLMLLGAINWGLIGAFDFNLVGRLFGEMSLVSRIIYLAVGLSAVGYFVAAMMDRFDDRGCFN